MKANPMARLLAFEHLEAKRSPTSLLLLLAPLGEQWHQESEDSLSERTVDSGAHWCQPHSASELLRFVEEQTPGDGQAARPWTTPTAVACKQADQMMKLHDNNLRATVITESLTT